MIQLNGHIEYTELERLVRCGDCVYAEPDGHWIWCNKLKIEVGPRFYCAIGQDWGIV